MARAGRTQQRENCSTSVETTGHYLNGFRLGTGDSVLSEDAAKARVLDRLVHVAEVSTVVLRQDSLTRFR